MKLLTKSRFKLGLECPNKLYFTGKENYANKKSEDTFLAALAKGGFQVEELARLQYPGGLFIDQESNDYEALSNLTIEALKNENIIIYEAAFMSEGYFVRTDIVEKRGNHINLIEVKSKSFDSTNEDVFLGKGGIYSKWKPYLFDLAFQKKVAETAHPHFEFNAFLMLADKSKAASINGLNQMFRIPNRGNQRLNIQRMFDSVDELGNSVLTVSDVDSIVNDILNDRYSCFDEADLKFDQVIRKFRDYYANDKYYNWPTKFSACKRCEFKCTTEDKDNGLLSGFEFCFREQHKWSDEDFTKPNIFEVWKLRGDWLMEANRMFLDEIIIDDLRIKEEPNQISSGQRQWIQIEKSRSGDNTIFALTYELKQEISEWKFPLHFIDFETSAVALPFTEGRHPYEQVAFQFSHHIYYESGKIEHKSQFINATPGEFPNFEFIRKLKKSLSNDSGTILRYASHENSILNAIYKQLKESKEYDKEELIYFIKSISMSRKNSTEKWIGERNMVDLKEVVQKYYYNPFTKGSNSLKAVLPAILKSSEFLKNKYSKSIGEIGLNSLNLGTEHIWLDLKNNQTDPYKSLPKLFEDWTDDEVEKTLSDMDRIDDGGAALTAYSKLQFVDMEDKEREELIDKLLKYCELDTLAMVMLYEHFVEITNASNQGYS